MQSYKPGLTVLKVHSQPHAEFISHTHNIKIPMDKPKVRPFMYALIYSFASATFSSVESL